MVKKPERLLPEDTFVMVMAEVELTEGALEYRREFRADGNDYEKRFYNYIYKKYNLTPVTLKENIDYYNSEPKKMMHLYDKILARLTEVQTEQELIRKKIAKRKRDSLSKLDTTHYIYKIIQYKPEKNNKKLWPILW